MKVNWNNLQIEQREGELILGFYEWALHENAERRPQAIAPLEPPRGKPSTRVRGLNHEPTL